jgi:hypothetical protein
MKKIFKIILKAQIIALIMGGILYQCIKKTEHPLLGLYVLITFWFITYNVILGVNKWIDKIFDNE